MLELRYRMYRLEAMTKKIVIKNLKQASDGGS